MQRNPRTLPNWTQVEYSGKHTRKTKNIGKLSPDLRFFMRSAAKGDFGIYELETGNSRGRFTIPSAQAPYAGGFFSRDGKYYFLPVKNVREENRLIAYSASTCKCIGELPMIGAFPFHASNQMGLIMIGPDRVAVSDDGRAAAIFDALGVIQVIDLTNGKVIRRLGKSRTEEEFAMGDSRPNLRLVLSPDGKALAEWNGADEQARVWDVKTGKNRLIIALDKVSGWPAPLAFSPDGRMLAIANDKIQIWEIETHRQRAALTGHMGTIEALTFSPNGRLLASGGQDTTVLIWDLWGL